MTFLAPSNYVPNQLGLKSMKLTGNLSGFYDKYRYSKCWPKVVFCSKLKIFLRIGCSYKKNVQDRKLKTATQLATAYFFFQQTETNKRALQIFLCVPSSGTYSVWNIFNKLFLLLVGLKGGANGIVCICINSHSATLPVLASRAEQ